jgi:hypothetical protein
VSARTSSITFGVTLKRINRRRRRLRTSKISSAISYISVQVLTYGLGATSSPLSLGPVACRVAALTGRSPNIAGGSRSCARARHGVLHSFGSTQVKS